MKKYSFVQEELGTVAVVGVLAVVNLWTTIGYPYIKYVLSPSRENAIKKTESKIVKLNMQLQNNKDQRKAYKIQQAIARYTRFLNSLNSIDDETYKKAIKFSASRGWIIPPFYGFSIRPGKEDSINMHAGN